MRPLKGERALIRVLKYILFEIQIKGHGIQQLASQANFFWIRLHWLISGFNCLNIGIQTKYGHALRPCEVRDKSIFNFIRIPLSTLWPLFPYVQNLEKKNKPRYTLEPKNTGTVTLFSFIFSQIFSIFSKSPQNFKMPYIPYERPKKWVFNFTKSKGMAAPKRQPCPWE